MNRKIIALLFALVCVLFSTQAFADDFESGIDIRLGLSASTLSLGQYDYSSKVGMVEEHILAGISGNLSIGYRWSYVGLYLEQDMGGFWSTFDSDDDYDYDEGGDEPSFLGGTFLVFRAFLPVTDSFFLEFGLGLGLMYSEEKGEEYKESIIMPRKSNGDEGDPIAFAAKFSFAMTYYANHVFGIGLHVDYDLGLQFFDFEETDINMKYHNVMPGIHVHLRF